MSDSENSEEQPAPEKKSGRKKHAAPPRENWFDSEKAVAAQKKSAEVRRHKGDMRESARIFARMALRAGPQASIEKINSLAESKGANLSLLNATVRVHWVKAMKGDPASTRILMDLMGFGSVAEVKVTETDETESLKKLKKKLADDPALLDRIIKDGRDGR